MKLSDSYKWVEHEHGTPELVHKGVRVVKTYYNYKDTKRYTYKSYRVFASRDMTDGRILKCGGKRGRPEKFGNTPDHCYIFNESVEGVQAHEKTGSPVVYRFCPKTLKDYGVIV